MTITARGNGYQANLTANGRRLRRKFDTKNQAEAWLLENKVKLLRGQNVSAGQEDSQSVTWEELRRSAHSKYWKGSKGETTAFINSSKVVEYFGPQTSLYDISIEQVDGFVESLERAGNSNATINRKLAAFSKMLKFALERGWINKMPALHRKREYEGRIRFLDKQEEEKLVKTMADMGFKEYADLCVFLVETGARVSEALGLLWKDVVDGKVTFWDTKSNRARTVPLTSKAAVTLASLSSNLKGPFLSLKQSTFNKVWNRTKGTMGLGGDAEFVPHCLRHTCASRLVQAKVSLLTVKEFLGHKSIQVTLRYAHLLPQNLMDAVKKLEES